MHLSFSSKVHCPFPGNSQLHIDWVVGLLYNLPSGKLTKQWTMPIFNTKYIFIHGTFSSHRYVSWSRSVTCNPVYVQRKYFFFRSFSSWWFQPIWKICLSNWIISPRFGVKIKNIWNHHQIIQFNWVFHYKPSILGCFPYFWNPPFRSFFNFPSGEDSVERHPPSHQRLPCRCCRHPGGVVGGGREPVLGGSSQLVSD